MTGTENVPGAEDGGVHSALTEQGFTFRPHLNISLHHRSGLAYAQVDEMPNSGGPGRLHRVPAGDQIDPAKFRGFRRIGMRNPNQLDESVGGLDLSGVRTAIESIAKHRLASGGSFFSDPGRTSARTS